MKCPICSKDVPPDSAHKPFCSDRCRLIDLGNWASEKYRISKPMDSRHEEEEQDDEQNRIR